MWEEDINPFRYCGEYFDVETNTLYLRNCDYRSGTGRFTQHDTHWNPGNMIYGDGADGQDSSKLNAYTSRTDIHAMMQSGNGYVYVLNNPGRYQDPSGMMFEPVSGSLSVVILECIFISLVLYYSIQIIFTNSYGKSVMLDSFVLAAADVADLAIKIGEVMGDTYASLSEQQFSSTYTDPIANPSNAMRSEVSSDTEGRSEADSDSQTLPDGTKVPEPRDNHGTKTGRVGDLPTTGDPDSSLDLKDKDGNLLQRRYYGQNGRAEFDIDFSHGNSHNNHEFPHKHIWDWSLKSPRQ